ncbi:MAG: ADP-ribosylglycohydrolase family protein [Planctomycetota bacterium]|nr:ADP-ribosylglycohydrolase family protein [Planctomycetota bacterium]
MQEERARGCLVGFAVGDALGAPLAFIKAEQVRIKHGVVREMIGGGWLGLRSGATSGETAQMRALAETLRDGAEYDAAAAAAAYIDWLRTDPVDAPNLTRLALEAIAEGAEPAEAARRAHELSQEKTADNATLGRCVPLALRYAGAALAGHAAGDARLTHHAPEAAGGSAGLCLLLSVLLAGEDDFDAARRAAEEGIADWGDGLPIVLRATDGVPRSNLRPTHDVIDTLEAALWCATHGKDFETALVEAVNLGGSTATIGAVAGALRGARDGIDAIPERWLRVLQDRLIHDRLASKIAAHFVVSS